MTSTQPRYKDIIKQIEELQKQADMLKAEERSKVLKEVRERIAVFEFREFLVIAKNSESNASVAIQVCDGLDIIILLVLIAPVD